MTTARRISVSLEDTDQAILDVFADPARAERAALDAWAAEHGMATPSHAEAALIRLLARVGAERLRDQAIEAGYAKLAATWDDDEERAALLLERRARRARYAARVDGESAE